MKRLTRFVYQHAEGIRYVITGAVTTVVNYAVYALVLAMAAGVEGDYHLANAAAFIISVLFAFFANKYAVFRDKSGGSRRTALQGAAFLVMRLASFGISEGLLFLMVDGMAMSKWIAKIIENAVIIAVNYFLSKYVIFKTG